jgi:DNA-directed RNA polymerase omega subunit
VETSQETGTFLLVNIAAQRARQLMQGAAPLIRTKSRKPAAIAIKEVEKGLLPFYTSDEAAQLLEEDTEEAAEPEE